MADIFILKILDYEEYLLPTNIVIIISIAHLIFYHIKAIFSHISMEAIVGRKKRSGDFSLLC